MSRIAQKLVALVLFFSIIGIAFSPLLQLPKKAEAQAAPNLAAACAQVIATVLGVGVTALSTATAAASFSVVITDPSLATFIGQTTSADMQNNFKQNCLNAIAWFIAKMLINNIAQSTISWINTGFAGQPGFVADPKQFFLSNAQSDSLKFLNDLFPTGLPVLCDNFKTSVYIGINNRFADDYFSKGQGNPTDLQNALKCKLSVSATVSSDFLSGNFNSGGWDLFYETTQTPENNYYGANYMAQSALDSKIDNAQSLQSVELNWGGGILSSKKMVGGTLQTVTPGAIIEHALEQVTTTDIRQLELADEFNEVIGALIGQMMKKIMGPGGGLLGLSQTSPSGGSAYLTQLANDFPTGNLPASTSLPAVLIGSTTFATTTSPMRKNLALYQNAYQSTTWDSQYYSAYAVDGLSADAASVNTFDNGISKNIALQREPHSWIEVDLGAQSTIDKINIWQGNGDPNRKLRNYYVFISDTPMPNVRIPLPGWANAPESPNPYTSLSTTKFWYKSTYYPTSQDPITLNNIPITINISPAVTGRYVRIQRYDNLYSADGNGGFSDVPIHELQVWGTQP